ncbi:MAG: DNA repair protein RecO [Anaerovoracaceae bacterium]
MYVDSEGIVLRQSKAVNGRQMVTIFTRKYGKISAGSNVVSKAKNKTALSIKPFTFGKFNFYKNRDMYNINGGETVKSFYRLGENIDKYMVCSYVLELTDKMLVEGEANVKLYNLLYDFLNEIEVRETKFMTLVVAYEVKALSILGYGFRLDQCGGCATKDNLTFLSVNDGGTLCENCGLTILNSNVESLIFHVDFGIIDIISFLEKKPLAYFRKLSLQEGSLETIRNFIKEYIRFHLDISKINSEDFINPS